MYKDVPGIIEDRQINQPKGSPLLELLCIAQKLFESKPNGVYCSLFFKSIHSMSMDPMYLEV